jgi:chlorobactene glucosyltransferase
MWRQAWYHIYIVIMALFLVCATILTALVAGFSLRLNRAFKRFKRTKEYTASALSPSVTVCIPARNEMHAMAGCLERVLASDYQKLEIIVFDDSSADDTSVLVRSFAHAGVRFVPGPELPDGWLGKNHALEVMANEASGTYVLFMDVDTFIQTTTISQLVDYMTGENLKMVSVIPGRADAWRPSVLFGHLRYFWELLLASYKTPATASSLWMIDRATLVDEYKGFESLKAEVEPEARLAARLGTSVYHCLINTPSLGVTYEKKWLSQIETSRRLLYPMVGGTPLKSILFLIMLLFLNIPTVAVVYGVIFGWSIIPCMALWLLLAFMAIYGVYTSLMWEKGWWIGGLLWPYIILQETILLVRSMWGYARHSITWKGRLVTAPSKSDSLVIDK